MCYVGGVSKARDEKVILMSQFAHNLMEFL